MYLLLNPLLLTREEWKKTVLFNDAVHFSRYYSVVGRRSTWINTCPMPYYPPKIPNRLAWNRTRSSAIRGWQLIAANEDDHRYYDDDNFEQGTLQMKWTWTLVWNAKYVQRQMLMTVFQEHSANVPHTVLSLHSRTGLWKDDLLGSVDIFGMALTWKTYMKCRHVKRWMWLELVFASNNGYCGSNNNQQ